MQMWRSFFKLVWCEYAEGPFSAFPVGSWYHGGRSTCFPVQPHICATARMRPVGRSGRCTCVLAVGRASRRAGGRAAGGRAVGRLGGRGDAFSHSTGDSCQTDGIRKHLLDDLHVSAVRGCSSVSSEGSISTASETRSHRLPVVRFVPAVRTFGSKPGTISTWCDPTVLLSRRRPPA